MARIECINCKVLLAQNPASYTREGAFALCGVCRRNPPDEYKCVGTNRSGKACQHTRLFNSTTCAHHKEGSK